MSAIGDFYEEVEKQRALEEKYASGYRDGWQEGRRRGWEAAIEALKSQIIGMELESPKFPE